MIRPEYRSSTALATSFAVFLAKSRRSRLLPDTLPRHSTMDRTPGPAKGEVRQGETNWTFLEKVRVNKGTEKPDDLLRNVFGLRCPFDDASAGKSGLVILEAWCRTGLSKYKATQAWNRVHWS